MAALSGALILDKPVGTTSFDAVRRVRNIIRVRKIGHGGTLDPLATGVLPLCLGDSTRLLAFLLDADKVYQARLMLGVQTDSLDAEGRVVARTPTDGVTPQAVHEAALHLTGTIDQVPPLFSAIKRQGVRLCDLARMGESPEPPEPRRVTIHSLEILSLALPEVEIRVRCSKGTYIRSLAADLGHHLAVGAHLTALRRLVSGPFSIDQAISLEDLQGVVDRGALEEALIAPRDILSHLSALELPAWAVPRIRQGWQPNARAVDQGRWLQPPPTTMGAHVRLLSPQGALVAVAQVRDEGLRLLRVMA